MNSELCGTEADDEDSYHDRMEFEAAWKATGYNYGEDALENVRLGWSLRCEWMRSQQGGQIPQGGLTAPDGSGIANSSGPTPAPSQPCVSAHCADCGVPYGIEGWCDVVIPNPIWNAISSREPTEGGILCFRCMTRRLIKYGYEDVPVLVASGPYKDSNEEWRLIGLEHGLKIAAEAAPIPATSQPSAADELQARLDDIHRTKPAIDEAASRFESVAAAAIATIRTLEAQLAARDEQLRRMREAIAKVESLRAWETDQERSDFLNALDELSMTTTDTGGK